MAEQILFLYLRLKDNFDEVYKFISKIEAKVDVKGRIFVPATYRRMLEAEGEASLCLRADRVMKCLRLYPTSEWDKIDKEFLSKLNMWDKNDQRLYRQFASSVEQIELDASGRILIQKKHLDAIGVEGEVQFVGMGSCFEIWTSENLDEELMSDEEFAEALQNKMGGAISL